MKRKEKAVRRFMALLAAVCMLGSMPDLSVVSHAAENGKESLETYDAGADGMEEISEDSDVKEQADGMEQEEDKDQHRARAAAPPVFLVTGPISPCGHVNPPQRLHDSKRARNPGTPA